MGNGCVKSNRLASNLGCIIRKADLALETSAESKQFATIVDRMKLYV